MNSSPKLEHLLTLRPSKKCHALLPSHTKIHNIIVLNSGFQTCPAHFARLPHLTHLIQIISSLVETERPDLGVSNKGDIQHVEGKRASRTGLKTTDLELLFQTFFIWSVHISPLIQTRLLFHWRKQYYGSRTIYFVQKWWFEDKNALMSSLYSNGLHGHQISINRASLGCGGTGYSHHGYSADKSAATAWCYHVNMDQNI